MTTTKLEVPLEDIPGCFEGIIPAAICTVAEDGTPNVTYLSVVQRVDAEHVALSRQFFNKTEHNTNVNPYAQVGVIDPATGRAFLLDLVYDRTASEGPLFERMRAKLDAVAASEGMTNVFKLKGTDVCRVAACTMLPGNAPQADPPARREARARRGSVTATRGCRVTWTRCWRRMLHACTETLGYAHVFIMLVDETGDRLYTVASAGFPSSGAGSEVRIGSGMVGIAAARRLTVRVTNMARDALVRRTRPRNPQASRTATRSSR